MSEQVMCTLVTIVKLVFDIVFLQHLSPFPTSPIFFIFFSFLPSYCFPFYLLHPCTIMLHTHTQIYIYILIHIHNLFPLCTLALHEHFFCHAAHVCVNKYGYINASIRVATSPFTLMSISISSASDLSGARAISRTCLNSSGNLF